MRSLTLALVALAALVGAGVVFAPASLVDARLAALTGNADPALSLSGGFIS